MGVARERTGHEQSHMGMPRLIHEEEEAANSVSVINFKRPPPSTNFNDSNLLDMWDWETSLITTTHQHPLGGYSDATTSLPQHSSFPHKRPHLGESSSTQTSKKLCTSKSKLLQNKSSSSSNNTALQSKDPQSIAAKNRRERMSERLKVLQELVPNGSKVDMVTMLEKAISYVKFLQLQAKVLETDEFWPVQGGKAPDISQVKEAIDAILSSKRDSRNSSSSSKS